MKISKALVDDFEAEAANTRRVLEAVPVEKLEFRPHAKSWTLAELAGHVAEGASFVHAVMEPEMDFARMDGEWKAFVPATKADLLAKCDEVTAAFRQLLDGREDDFLQETWTMRAGPQILWQCPRHVAVRTMGIHHTIHHRGQLEVYLRLCDAPLPPIYGPTADVPKLF